MGLDVCSCLHPQQGLTNLLFQVLDAKGKLSKATAPYACALAASLSVESPFVAHDAQAVCTLTTELHSTILRLGQSQCSHTSGWQAVAYAMLSSACCCFSHARHQA